MASLGSLVIELAANTATLQSDLGKAVGIAERAAGKIGGAFRGLATLAGAGSLGALAAHAIEVGDNLNKAAIKAGLSAQPMSELAHAAKMADVDLQSLSGALSKMQRNLSEATTGGKAQNDTLTALGLTFQKINALAPDQQFELIADRISKLSDPAQRARAAVEMFGKSGAELLPMFEKGAEGIRKAREEAKKLGGSFTDDQIQRLADADDSIKRLKASFENFAVVMTAKVAPALSSFLDKYVNPQIESLNSLEMKLKSIAGGYDEVAKASLRSQIEQRKRMDANSLWVEQVGPVAPGGSSRGRGTSIPGFKPDAKPVDLLPEIKISAQKIQEDSYKAYLERLQKATLTESEAEVSAYREKMAMLDVLLQEHQITQEQYNARTGEVFKDMNATLLGEFQVTQNYVKDTSKSMSVYAEQAARNMQDAFANFLFDPFKDGLKGMLSGFLNVIKRMVAEQAAAKLFGSKSSGGLGWGDAISAVFGGFKASGGPVSSGTPYVVGEKGPELFVPGSSGSIIPNGAGKGSSPTINLSIDARGSTQDAVQMLPAIAHQIISQAVQMSRAAVRDDMSRSMGRA